jgi:peptide/nickel transport system substrate-binding protein
MMSGFLNAGCEKAMFGWPCDAEIEKLRDAYARETDTTKLKPLVEQIQKRWAEYPTHVHLGQYYQPVAMKATLDGAMIAPVPVFWNLDRK